MLHVSYQRIVYTFAIILISCFFYSCEFEEAQPAKPLFELLSSEVSGIRFQNRLRESPTRNVLNYEYYYNGAGLAVADFNGDELPDIFFVSNIEPNVLYLNQGNLSFKDISQESGARGQRGFYTGVTIVDINHDGLWDLYLCKSGRFDQPDLRRNELLLNQGLNNEGIPIFKESAKAYGLDIESYSTQASFFDYDKDGDLDLFLINHGIDTYAYEDIPDWKNSQDGLSGVMLFQNDQDRFINVTEKAGLENNRLGFGLGLAVGDLNQDNWPDVYVSNDYSGKDHLYINQKDGTFQEKISELTGHTSFYAMGNDIADINNDGWEDIVNLDMVAQDNYGIKTSMSAMNPAQFGQLVSEGQHRQYMYNTLLLNNGSIHPDSLPQFSDIAKMCGLGSTDWSWAPLLFDFDNDGWRDLFITNGIKRNIRNNDAVKEVGRLRKLLPQARNQQEKSRLIQQMLQKFPYHRKPNYFFRNTQELSFENLNSYLGIDSIPTASNGAAYADLDLDGDLDLIINNVDQEAFLYKNNSRENKAGNYIQITARGPSENIQGIGLQVFIYHKGLLQRGALYPSRGYMSSVDPLIHFGLGEMDKIDTLLAVWPDGKTNLLKEIKTNQRLSIDYQQSKDYPFPSSAFQGDPLFLSTSIQGKADHKENEFDDFERESLLPHKMSQMGPAFVVGDVNGDGLEDYFMGGAKGFPAQLFLQNQEGDFSQVFSAFWEREKSWEDVSAALLDAEGDGDLDLVIGSGSNEAKAGSKAYQLRLYENEGNGQFSRNQTWGGVIRESVGVIAPGDIDGDGDLDLFIGGRQVPGKYPLPANSYLLINESKEDIHFSDQTSLIAPFLHTYGMVTDATWADMDQNGYLDLVTVGEWMAPTVLFSDGKSLQKGDSSTGMDEYVGWWFGCAVADLDQDGDMDIIGGNLGLNYKYQASSEAPFEVYAKDFDENGSIDIVLGYHEEGNSFPLRGRECSSNQMPFIKTKFPNYDAFGKATLTDVFGQNDLQSSVGYKVTNFASGWFENDGKGNFMMHPFPRQAQISSVNDILVADFNGDDHLDLLLGGNLLGSEVETPRNDGSIGLLLLGQADLSFIPVPSSKSGIQILGEVRSIFSINKGGRNMILISKNQGSIQEIGLNE